jgi:GPH family glycoside/pentoside/hexuronide:cation symporter
MTVYAVIAIGLFLLTFATTRERVLPPKAQITSLSRDIRDLFNNVPWVILFIAGICLLTYVSIRNGSIMYYFKYFVEDQEVNLFGKSRLVSHDKLASMFMVFGSIANIVGVLCTPLISKHIGKVKGYILMMILATGFTSIYWILDPANVLWMFSLQVLISFVMGPMSPILWSMYTDAADYSEWKYGRRATGLVMSASTMAQKLGWTIGGSVAGWLLAAFGFQANMAQSVEAISGIKLMMSFIPAIGGIVGALVMLLYKLDNKTMKQIEEELEERKSAG